MTENQLDQRLGGCIAQPFQALLLRYRSTGIPVAADLMMASKTYAP